MVDILLITIGYVLSLSLYHFYIAFGRKQNKEIIAFAVLLIMISLPLIYRVFYSNGYVTKYSPIINYLLGLYLAFYANRIFGSEKYTKILFSFCIIALINLFLINLNFKPAIYFTSFLAVVAFVIVGLIIQNFIRKKLYKDTWRLYVLVGLTLYAIGFLLNSAIYGLARFEDYFLASNIALSSSTILLSFLSAIGLAQKFNEEYNELVNLKTSLEDQVIQRTAELEVAHKQKEMTFINIAHEIKTPVTIINNLIGEYIKNKDSMDILNEIRYWIYDLMNICCNYLDVNKMSDGIQIYKNNEIINLSKYVLKKLKLFSEYASKSIITLTTDIENDVCVKADPGAIDRIVTNLVDNAIKYNKKSGAIRISIKTTQEYAIFSIYDTGIGISEEQLSHLFQPFYQCENTKSNKQGSGLGLSIVKNIVESLSGEISVKSKYGTETEFIVKIPLCIEKEISLKQENLEPNPINPLINKEYNFSDPEFIDEYKPIVLLVEDNKSLLSNLRNNFKDRYNVICAENGKEVLKKIYKIKPDLIISDIMMDDMDGIELITKLKNENNTKDIPLVFLTAKSTINDEYKGLELGAIDYIYKPFDMELLNVKVFNILEYNAIKNNLIKNEKYRTIGLLTASISHELINPLSSIKGPLEFLEENLEKTDILTNSEVKKDLEYIKDGVKRIENLVINLKSIYKGDNLTIEPVNVKHIIDNIIRIYRIDKDNSNIEFVIDINENLYINGSESALSQIFANIINNAIDAIFVSKKNAGKIIITGKDDDISIEIIVTDNGCGIDAKEIEHIFDPMFTTKKFNTGSGLGLYIVKEIVKKLNGTITVKSELNVGTSFIIKFRK